MNGKKGREERAESGSLHLTPSRALKGSRSAENQASATRLWVIIDVLWGKREKEGLKMKEVRREMGKFSGSQDTFIRSF